MKKAIFILLMATGAMQVRAQEVSGTHMNVGVEIDAMFYITDGYFAAAWAGKGQWRSES